MRRSGRGVLGLLGDAARRWWAIAELVPRAGWRLVSLSIVANLVFGLLPIAFLIGTSTAIGHIESLAEVSPGAVSWRPVVPALALAVTALAVQNLLTPFQAALGELITRRIDGYCIRRLIHASLVDAPMLVLEEADMVAALNDTRSGLSQSWLTPGSAAVGLLALVARYAQMLGAVVVIGVVLGPAAALVIGGAVYIARVGWRDSVTRYSMFLEKQAGARLSVNYVLQTGVKPELAKEMRVLGILDWFRARAEAEINSYWLPIWRERVRIGVAPFAVYAVVLITGISTVLIMLRDAAMRNSLSVLDISLVAQSIFVAVTFAGFFPEADVPTQFGTATNEAMRKAQRRFAESGRRTTGGQLDALTVPASSIRFEGVSFAYPGGEKNVLDGLDLDLKVGESTAIVGLNGAGKTTLVKLLGRLYEPDSGRIVVDGVDIAKYETASWQRRLAVIFQDFAHYELDAMTNVVLAAPQKSGVGSAYNRATERAGAARLIEALPEKDATILSSRYAGGVDLSGGEWQRIALARALFAVEEGAAVLVLDEPTAQLDVRAEVAFFDNFLELTRGLTTIVVSHRFSTVRRADRIVVLEGGRVVEAGSHDKLIAAGGRYADLFALQARRFAEGLTAEPDDESDRSVTT